MADRIECIGHMSGGEAEPNDGSGGPMEVTSGFAEVNGAHLYYEVRGGGPPLVLLHAGIADSRMWDDQVEAFAERYRVIRYDLRGFGKSDLPAGAFSMRDDLFHLLQALGVERGVARAHLVGVSMGGGIAVDFALEHPEMVAALVLVGSSLSGREPSEQFKQLRERIWAAVGEIGEDDARRRVEAPLRLWVDGPSRTPDQVDPRVRERVGTMIAGNLDRPWDKAKSQPLDPPAPARLGEIHAPTLVLVGELDVPDILATADLLVSGAAGPPGASGIPNVRKIVLPGVAHMPNMEQPAEFTRHALAFLEGTDRSIWSAD
jgi:3-oxoadipate enol-lactonase